MKIAVVGTGIIGKAHLTAIQKSMDCELCAVCDINETVAASYAEEYHVPYLTDYKDIPSQTDADAVILNLPHWLHCEATVFFLEHGLHVLVEKPMANSTEECNKMIAAAHNSGKCLAVGHPQRFVDANRVVKDAIASGQIGKLCMVSEIRSIDYFNEKRPKWFLNKKLAGGGIVMNYGAHALDKLYSMMNCKPLEIHADVGNFKNDCNIEGHAQIFVKFENDVTANITFSGYNSVGYETIYYFTEGALKVVSTTQLYKRKDSVWEPVKIEGSVNHMDRQLDAFCKMVRGEETEMPDGEYGASIIAAIEEIYR